MTDPQILHDQAQIFLLHLTFVLDHPRMHLKSASTQQGYSLARIAGLLLVLDTPKGKGEPCCRNEWRL